MPENFSRPFPPATQRKRDAHVAKARTTSKEHGRKVTRTLEVSSRIVDGLAWPGLAQICCLKRETLRDGKRIREVQYAITSLPPQRASPAQLIELWRSHWGIENRVHWVRDTLWFEDKCQVRHPRGGHNLAAFRNAAINLLRLAEVPNLTAAIRANAYRSTVYSLNWYIETLNPPGLQVIASMALALPVRITT